MVSSSPEKRQKAMLKGLFAHHHARLLAIHFPPTPTTMGRLFSRTHPPPITELRHPPTMLENKRGVLNQHHPLNVVLFHALENPNHNIYNTIKLDREVGERQWKVWDMLLYIHATLEQGYHHHIHTHTIHVPAYHLSPITTSH